MLNEILIITFFSLIAVYIFYKIFYWLTTLLLASLNEKAQYNEISKKTILELAEKDRVWKDVSKILKLESKGE